MIYKFKSKACGDVLMLGPHGDQLLRLLGREPATQGVFEVAAMPTMVQVLEAAIVQATQAPAADTTGQDEEGARDVGLRQRLWPMIDMLKRAHAQQERIVWGV